MTSHDEVMEAMKAALGGSATLNNSIRAPLGGKDDDNFQIIFNSYMPRKIQIFSYGATFTVTYNYDSGPSESFKLTHGTPKVLPSPPGAKTFYATISAISVDPGSQTASVVTTFD